MESLIGVAYIESQHPVSDVIRIQLDFYCGHGVGAFLGFGAFLGNDDLSPDIPPCLLIISLLKSLR
jgi:hypothetical protein